MTEYAVTSVSEIQTALTRTSPAIQAGDVLVCAAGNYGTMTLSINANAKYGTLPDKVFIRSADPLNPAIFTVIDLRGLVNVEFQYIEVRTTSGQLTVPWAQAVSLTSCTNVTFRNCQMIGANGTGLTGSWASVNGYGVGQGFAMSACSSCSLINSRVSNWTYGPGASRCDDTLFEGNEIDSIYADSMTFTGSQRVRVINNYFHDHRNAEGDGLEDTTGLHADNIQMANGTNRHNEDIVIHSNRICEFTNVGTQTIFSTAYSGNLVTDNPTKFTGNWIWYLNATVNVGTYVSYPIGFSIAQQQAGGITNPYVSGKCYGYICKVQHTGGANSAQPDVGSNWRDYWDGPFEWEMVSYKNFTITDNLTYSATTHGISLANDIGKTIIKDNTLLYNPRITSTSVRASVVLPQYASYAPYEGSYLAIRNLDMQNNVAWGGLEGLNPQAGSIWNVANNQTLTALNQATFFPGVATATKVSDLYAASTVLSNRRGSSWTLPKLNGGGIGF